MERKTQQRDAIRKVFSECHRPLSTLEVLDAAQKHVKKLGIATVYRNLKDMVGEGELVPVELPGEAPRYEAAGKAHHHHFHCRKCEKVFEIDGCPGDLSKLMPRGFKLESHEIVLYGACPKCASKK